jgi:GDP-L-fucose synthase
MPGKRVVVTGGNGFFGSHLVPKLRARPWVGDVLVPRSHEYDLREKEAVERMYEDLRPDIVIHLAGVVGGIGANRKQPAKFFYDNLLMGLFTMHGAYERGVEKLVAIGTICAYPKFTPVPFREEDLWEGYPEETNAPYGLAKKMLLVQAQAYREEYGFNAIYLLPVNLYGPGDRDDLETSHVIPALIRRFLEAKERGDATVTLWGDGSPSREFLYVEDGAEAIVLATERYNGPDPVNIGSSQEITIRELAQTIASLIGYGGEILWDTSKPNGQPRRCLDTRRAKEFFGFEAQMPFEEGLQRTIDWYRAHHAAQPSALLGPRSW